MSSEISSITQYPKPTYLCCKSKLTIITSIILMLISSSLICQSLYSIQTTLTDKNNYVQGTKNTQECGVYCGRQFQYTNGKNQVCCDKHGNYCIEKSQCYAKTMNDFEDKISQNYIIMGASGGVFIVFTIYIIIRYRWLQKQKTGLSRLDSSIHYDLLAQNRPNISNNRFRQSLNTLQTVGGQCAICLDGFERAKIIKLNCKHVFHSPCIKVWMKEHNSCPICRAKT